MKFNNMVKRELVASRQILIIFRRLMKLLYWYPLICSGSDVLLSVGLASVSGLHVIVLHCVEMILYIMSLSDMQI